MHDGALLGNRARGKHEARPKANISNKNSTSYTKTAKRGSCRMGESAYWRVRLNGPKWRGLGLAPATRVGRLSSSQLSLRKASDPTGDATDGWT
jgi:hypothetical protein